MLPEALMKALTWHGKRDVRVDDVPDPVLKEPTDAIVRVTSTGLCGSDLLLPDAAARKLMQKTGIDRLAALLAGIDAVRRGGTLSLSGVYGGMTDPLPLQMFDKQLTVRMGQANVRRWIDDLIPLLTDEDPLGVHDFVTHEVPLAEAPDAYAMFQKKQDGAVKVVFRP